MLTMLAAAVLARVVAVVWLPPVQVPAFLGAGARQFVFMLKGLQELAPKLQAAGIPFFLLQVGLPATHIPTGPPGLGLTAQCVCKQQQPEAIQQQPCEPMQAQHAVGNSTCCVLLHQLVEA